MHHAFACHLQRRSRDGYGHGAVTVVHGRQSVIRAAHIIGIVHRLKGVRAERVVLGKVVNDANSAGVRGKRPELELPREQAAAVLVVGNEALGHVGRLPVGCSVLMIRDDAVIHDLGLVGHINDRAITLYGNRVSVERGRVADIDVGTSGNGVIEPHHELTTGKVHVKVAGIARGAVLVGEHADRVQVDRVLAVGGVIEDEAREVRLRMDGRQPLRRGCQLGREHLLLHCALGVHVAHNNACLGGLRVVGVVVRHHGHGVLVSATVDALVGVVRGIGDAILLSLCVCGQFGGARHHLVPAKARGARPPG